MARFGESNAYCGRSPVLRDPVALPASAVVAGFCAGCSDDEENQRLYQGCLAGSLATVGWSAAGAVRAVGGVACGSGLACAAGARSGAAWTGAGWFTGAVGRVIAGGVDGGVAVWPGES